MSAPTRPVGGSRINWRVVSIIIAGTFVAVVLTANAHFLHVALESQPECVPHLKTAGEEGQYRAARSSC